MLKLHSWQWCKQKIGYILGVIVPLTVYTMKSPKYYIVTSDSRGSNIALLRMRLVEAEGNNVDRRPIFRCKGVRNHLIKV